MFVVLPRPLPLVDFTNEFKKNLSTFGVPETVWSRRDPEDTKSSVEKGGVKKSATPSKDGEKDVTLSDTISDDCRSRVLRSVNKVESLVSYT